MVNDKEDWARSTLAVQALHMIDQATGAIVPGIEPSSTFARGPGYELLGETSYARYSNPTARIVEDVLASLEGAPDALVFNAGMAATYTPMTRTATMQSSRGRYFILSFINALMARPPRSAS